MKLMIILCLCTLAKAESFQYEHKPEQDGTKFITKGNWFPIRDGLMMTCAHNVDVKKVPLKEILVNGKKAKVVAYDRELDLAILKYPTSDPVTLGNRLTVGSEVVIQGEHGPVGGPNTRKAVVRQLYWEGGFRARLGMDKVPMVRGLSGAPVLVDNKVVAVVSAGVEGKGKTEIDPDVCLVIPIEVIQEVLRRYDNAVYQKECCD